MAENKKRDPAVRSSAAEYLTFVASAGESDASFEMRYEDENIWLTQRMMATLYDVDVRTIGAPGRIRAEQSKPSSMRKRNMKSIGSCRIAFMKAILTAFSCWNRR